MNCKKKGLSKVWLCLAKEGNYIFFKLFLVTILGYEVAVITSKHNVRNFFGCIFGHWYRFAEVSKMINNSIS